MIIGCRDIERGQDAAEEINIQVVNNGKVHFKQLDLASFDSIKRFAYEINEEENSIDILINNAGVLFTNLEDKTKDGFEMTFGVNYLGHFLLTFLLLDKLRQSKSSTARIINVTSLYYARTTIQFDDINSVNNFNPLKAYGQSKLALNLFTCELAKRLRGSHVRVYCVHPGQS